MRILFHGVAPWAGSGYGVSSKNLIPRLQKLGHKIVVFSVYGLHGGRVQWVNPEDPKAEPIEVWPTKLTQWGSDVIVDYVQEFQADCVLTLYDQWAMPSYQQLGDIWIPYCVLHYDPMEEPLYNAVKDTWRQFTLCEWAVPVLKKAGLHPVAVPLGVDTHAFRPLIGELSLDGQVITKEGCRSYKNWPMMPRDKFIVGMVAANRDDRKNLEAQLRVFADFVKKYPDSHLVFHTNPGPDAQGALDLPRMIKAYGVADNVDITSRDQADYSTQEMCLLYNTFDVFLNCAQSEGFGLPVLEAQSCGVPGIVTDFSAMAEVCGAGWKLPYRKILTLMYSFGAQVDEQALYDALVEAHDMQGTPEWDALKTQAREHALKYDWDVLVEKYWEPALEAWWTEKVL